MTPAELRERVRLELAYSTTAQSLIRIDAAIRVVVEACAEIAADWPNDGNEGVSDTYHCQLGDAAAVKREIAAGLRALLPEAPDAPTRTELLIEAAEAVRNPNPLNRYRGHAVDAGTALDAIKAGMFAALSPEQES